MAAILFPCHPYIRSTTVLHDITPLFGTANSRLYLVAVEKSRGRPGITYHVHDEG